ncbi:response regulator transcription factor [Novosphingobium resinovorum]|nr:response regulator transcription factor [Novosphingobium resinovorum]
MIQSEHIRQSPLSGGYPRQGRRGYTQPMEDSDFQAPIRIAVVDDHPLLRDGIIAVFATQPDLELIAVGEDGEAAVRIYRDERPDILLLDLQMPNVDGVEAMTRILAEFPEARILVLTTYSGDGRATQAIKAGASGYLLKNSLRTELLDAIRSVHRGGTHFDRQVFGAADREAKRLTARESDVLELAAAGNSNKQIAARLSLSEDTVKGYMKAIFARLGAMDRTHAVAIAVRNGLIEL